MSSRDTEEYHILKVLPEEEGLRLDQFIAIKLVSESRSYMQKIIKEGRVLVDKICKKKPSYKVKAGESIEVTLPVPVSLEAIPQDIPIDVIYEDDSVIVVNKPSGMVVHPSAGHCAGTLVNALLYHCRGNLSSIGGVLRPGIVHRLDKDTSGCLVVAKDDYSHRMLTEQFQNRQVLKEYMAIVRGWVKELKGEIKMPIGRHPVHRKKMTAVNPVNNGKEAETEYGVIERFEQASYLLLRLRTGRTHQVRVHMAYMGHPVLGDIEYGRKRAILRGLDIPRLMLHAYRLGFYHPLLKEWMEFTAPVPQDMEIVLEALRQKALKNGRKV